MTTWRSACAPSSRTTRPADLPKRAREIHTKVLPVIDKRLPQPKVLPPAYESNAKRSASSVDEAEQRKQARRDEPAAAPSPTKPKTAPSYADPAWPAVPPPKPDAPPKDEFLECGADPQPRAEAGGAAARAAGATADGTAH